VRTNEATTRSVRRAWYSTKDKVTGGLEGSRRELRKMKGKYLSPSSVHQKGSSSLRSRTKQDGVKKSEVCAVLGGLGRNRWGSQASNSKGGELRQGKSQSNLKKKNSTKK